MEIHEVRDGKVWDDVLLSLPRPHILQSYRWGLIKGATGWRPRHLLLEEHGQVRAAEMVLRRALPLFRLAVLYVPKGPLLVSPDDPLLWDRVLQLLEGEARQQRAIFVKVDPDIPAGDRQVVEILRRRGWRRAEGVQFRNTVHVDLCADDEALLGRMKSKTRYNVRLAARRGVEVRAGHVDDLPAFYSLYAQTGRRDGFVVRPYAYYRVVWQTFLEAGQARLLLAEHEGDLLGGLLVVRFGRCAWYMYGGSSGHKRQLMPNYLLQWEAMRWARAEGCTTYDLWGAPDLLDPSDPLWGLYRFKEGFGGRFVAQIGAYDYVVQPALYLLYTWAVPRVLALWRRLRGEPTLGQAGPRWPSATKEDADRGGSAQGRGLGRGCGPGGRRPSRPQARAFQLRQRHAGGRTAC